MTSPVRRSRSLDVPSQDQTSLGGIASPFPGQGPPGYCRGSQQPSETMPTMYHANPWTSHANHSNTAPHEPPKQSPIFRSLSGVPPLPPSPQTPSSSSKSKNSSPSGKEEDMVPKSRPRLSVVPAIAPPEGHSLSRTTSAPPLYGLTTSGLGIQSGLGGNSSQGFHSEASTPDHLSQYSSSSASLSPINCGSSTTSSPERERRQYHHSPVSGGGGGGGLLPRTKLSRTSSCPPLGDVEEDSEEFLGGDEEGISDHSGGLKSHQSVVRQKRKRPIPLPTNQAKAGSKGSPVSATASASPAASRQQLNTKTGTQTAGGANRMSVHSIQELTPTKKEVPAEGYDEEEEEEEEQRRDDHGESSQGGGSGMEDVVAETSFHQTNSHKNRHGNPTLEGKGGRSRGKKEKGVGRVSSSSSHGGSEEAPKDYIHVRARRGQATDSHSLAERVRREKISERMKVLQELVPTCSKVTGKAFMLDEIINYVRSLQLQVELLSSKLAAINNEAAMEELQSSQPFQYGIPMDPSPHVLKQENNLGSEWNNGNQMELLELLKYFPGITSISDLISLANTSAATAPDSSVGFGLNSEGRTEERSMQDLLAGSTQGMQSLAIGRMGEHAIGGQGGMDGGPWGDDLSKLVGLSSPDFQGYQQNHFVKLEPE